MRPPNDTPRSNGASPGCAPRRGYRPAGGRRSVPPSAGPGGGRGPDPPAPHPGPSHDGDRAPRRGEHPGFRGRRLGVLAPDGRGERRVPEAPRPGRGHEHRARVRVRPDLLVPGGRAQRRGAPSSRPRRVRRGGDGAVQRRQRPSRVRRTERGRGLPADGRRGGGGGPEGPGGGRVARGIGDRGVPCRLSGASRVRVPARRGRGGPAVPGRGDVARRAVHLPPLPRPGVAGPL